MSQRIEERVGSNRLQSAHTVFQIGGLVGLLRRYVVSRPSRKRARPEDAATSSEQEQGAMKKKK